MPTSANPRRSLFAVWHWPRWVWVPIVLLMLLSYPAWLVGLFIYGNANPDRVPPGTTLLKFAFTPLIEFFQLLVGR